MAPAARTLTEQIDDAIRSLTHVHGRTLRIDEADGQITLHGQVSSYFQKQMAQEAVRRVDGVRGIRNLIEVQWAEIQKA